MKLFFLLLLPTPLLVGKPDGELLYTQNCFACHQPEQALVGPSLAEIRELYFGKPEEFVKWSIEPEKKRPNAIEMPSMVHVGEEGLLAVYEHIMKVSEGLKRVEAKNEDPFGMSAIHARRPQVQRIFMPDAGPAAIAVALNDRVSLCWDAGSSRLRYVWTGGFIDGFPYWRGNGHALARIIGERRYTESDWLFGGDVEPQFLGYDVREELPTFRYKIGTTEVSERFEPLEDGDGFTRSFMMEPPPNRSLVLNFPSDQEAGLASDKGVWAGTTLTLSAADAAAFTITFSLK